MICTEEQNYDFTSAGPEGMKVKYEECLCSDY